MCVDTPRTDGAVMIVECEGRRVAAVHADLARDLERELEALKGRIVREINAHDRAAEADWLCGEGHEWNLRRLRGMLNGGSDE